MKKLKTRKSASKRVKIKKFFFFRKKAFKGHLMKSKNAKRIRHLSQQAVIHQSDMASFALMNPYC